LERIVNHSFGGIINHDVSLLFVLCLIINKEGTYVERIILAIMMIMVIMDIMNIMMIMAIMNIMVIMNIMAILVIM